ncbi:MAG: aspartate kinase [Catonella sp.]|uniref:aspartate kinase n=1 Tax=Catonella sp. TaxID=2382125 RepID=UPI003F9F77F0
MLKVVKFGGSSLANAEQFKKVGDIIKLENERRYAIPSAPGKRFNADIKVTDLLYKCQEKSANNEDFSEEFTDIKSRYNEIIEGLGIDLSLEEEFAVIEKNLKEKAGKDYAASRGEYLNGIIMSKYLGFTFIDAATVLFFNKDGIFDSEKTNEILGEKLKNIEYAVIPGFYGALPDGTIKTFSRGGSDITGAIVARAVKADVYENWTDVSGFLVADPRIIYDPKPIDIITYKELRELSYMGASVLHEDSIFPVRIAGIPVNIKNTNAPEEPGSWIVESTGQKSKYIITGIAGRKGFSAINIDKDMMNVEVGFGRKVLQAFEENNISFEHMPSGIDTMTLFVEQKAFEPKEQLVVSAIHKLAEPDSIEIESGIALVAVVGRGMKSVRGTAGRIFAALAHARINVRMIDQGSSELNIIIGVDNDDFELAIKAIYDIFVEVQL